MDLQNLAAILFITGFVLVVIASIAGPSKVYQVQDAEARIEIVAQNRKGWFASNLFWALAGIVTGVGFLLLSLHLRDSVPIALNGLAAVSYLAGAAAWAYFVIQRQSPADPESSQGPKVCHYSDIRRFDAKNSLMAVVTGGVA